MDKTLKVVLAAIVVFGLVFVGDGAKVNVKGPDGETTEVQVVTPEGESGEAVFDWLAGIVKQLPNVVTVAAFNGFIAAAYNLLKMTGLLSRFDGKSQQIVTAVGAVLFIVASAANFLGYGDRAREILEALGPALAVCTGLLALLAGQTAVHKAMRYFASRAFSISVLKGSKAAG